MKKFILSTMAALTFLFAQSQCQADFSYMQNGPTTIFTDLSTVDKKLFNLLRNFELLASVNPVNTYTL
jgi:hypothetical protein